MGQLEDDIDALVERFARDFLSILRRVPIGEVGRAVGRPHPARAGGSVADWTARYRLSKAEAAILAAAVDGKSRREIARSRGTSVDTVKRQAHGLLAKTGDPSVLAATNRLLRERR